MTFASLEKLIRKEIRKVVENLERSFSLSEEDEKPASENPDKMLVVNKESGKSYYINKDSFDPSKHSKSTPKETTKEEEEPAAETKPEETPKEEPTKDSEDASKTKDSESSDTEKPKDDAKDKEEKKPEEKPKEPNEEKTGLKTVGFVNKVDSQKLEKKSSLLYPESREKLLQYDFEEILDVYDSAIKEKKDLKNLYKKIERISVSKHSLISQKDLDRQTIIALQHYYTNTDKINNIIRFSSPSVSKKEIENQIKLGKPKEGDAREKKYNSAMNAFTIYELDYAFLEQPQRLESNILSYRSVENKNVLQVFIDKGQWIDNSFVTTSLNPLICEGSGKKRLPLFEFFIPAGTSVLTLPCHSNDYCHETEVTLPRNCRYTIQGFNSQRNIYKILVEENYGRWKKNWYKG